MQSNYKNYDWDSLISKLPIKKTPEDRKKRKELWRQIDINGNNHLGEMVCHRSIAQDLVEIFRELYKAHYPIERMLLIDEYQADDETSMRANNSSCFNYIQNLFSERSK